MGCCCCKDRHISAFDESLLHDTAVYPPASSAADEIDRILNSTISPIITRNCSPNGSSHISLPGASERSSPEYFDRFGQRMPEWGFNPISNRKVGPIVCSSSVCTGTDLEDCLDNMSVSSRSSHTSRNAQYCATSITSITSPTGRLSIDSTGYVTPFSDIDEMMMQDTQ